MRWSPWPKANPRLTAKSARCTSPGRRGAHCSTATSAITLQNATQRRVTSDQPALGSHPPRHVATGSSVMCAEPLLTELGQRFQGLLNAALTKGIAPPVDLVLVPARWTRWPWWPVSIPKPPRTHCPRLRHVLDRTWHRPPLSAGFACAAGVLGFSFSRARRGVIYRVHRAGQR